MDGDRWHRLNDLFQAALDRPPERRAAFLDEACGDDPPLRDELSSLLASHDRATSFLEVPAIAGDPTALAPVGRDITPGRQLGPYRITAKIGQGGMGVVYLAEDTRLGRRVALKALAPEFTDNERRRERLRREARTAASLSHPGIATIYALEELDGDLFIASEYVPGRTLRDELTSGAFPQEALLGVALDIARALTAAHEQGVIHRDLKPENVIRCDDGSIKILDFGLARFERATGASMTHLTEAGTILGTPAYMSPEQLRARPVDFRTDIFSFGVLLYEMASGIHPFAGSDTASTIVRVLEWEPPDVSETNPSAPHDLDRVVRRCLQKDPDARYARTRHLVEDLDALRRGRSAEPPVPRRSSGVSAGREAQVARSRWWRFHQIYTAVVYCVMLVPLWSVRSWTPRPYGSIIFFTGVLVVSVSANLRIHLSFTSRVYPDELPEQRARLGRWVRAADWLFVLLLVGAGLLVLESHAATAALLLSVAVAAFVACLVIEPATTRAAFGPDTSQVSQ